MKQQKEKKLSHNVAEWFELQYPKLIMRFDVASDLRMSIGQASIIKNKLRHKRGFNDITIFAMRNGYGAMLVELKNCKEDVYLKDGVTISRGKHIQEQHAVHEQLRKEGYYVVWGLGWDDTIAKIKEYIKS